jgi:hypothetical protein
VKLDDRPDPLTASERRWLEVRRHLVAHRFGLAVTAVDDYPAARRVAGTPLLADPAWLPSVPLPLDAVNLHFDPTRPARGLTGDEPAFDEVRPVAADGRRYPTYAAAVAALARPATFVNRPTYRLDDADLTADQPALRFGLGHYFDGLNIGEASAHEYAAHQLEHGRTPLRATAKAPWDLTRRSTNVAISTLTLRLDRAAGEASFLLHRRDPAKVGHAGGLYQVIPVGVFQPSDPAPWNETNDFDLWRNTIREYSEELLGAPESYASDRAPIDYPAWPFAARLTRARERGEVRMLVLGLGTDPLTFATDILTVAVFDAPVFDELFTDLVTDNNEGRIVTTLAGTGGQTGAGIPFTEDTVDHVAHHQPMQAAGAALLTLAWHHHDTLLR